MEAAPPAEPAEEPAPAADEPAPAAAEPEPEAAAEEEETEESKKRSLHAAIFGDDSDSDGDDDNLPSLAHPESEKVKRVLGKGKASSKKDKGKPDGAPRKRLKKADEGSSSAADAAAAAGEADEGAQGVVDGGFAEEGVEGAAAPDSDDDDSESDGPGGGRAAEAVEAGGKNDIEAMLTKLKPRRGKIVRSREALTQEVVELQQQMEAAAERDDDAVRSAAGEPAIHKAADTGRCGEMRGDVGRCGEM